MRITKSDAESVAIKMTEKKQKEIDKVDKELSEYGYQLAKSLVKKDVMDFFAKHPEYTLSAEKISVTGVGMSWETIYFVGKRIPMVNPGTCKSVTNEQAKHIVSLMNKKNDLKKEKAKLFKDIEVALLSLGTYNKVKEQFKEAAPFLPFKQKSEIVVNLNDIRKRI